MMMSCTRQRCEARPSERDTNGDEGTDRFIVASFVWCFRLHVSYAATMETIQLTV
jgi:hypothetical protein